VGYDSIGVELDGDYFRAAKFAIPKLASLYPGCIGESLELPQTDASHTRRTRNNPIDPPQLCLFSQ
jgi:hypothetical protein